MTKRLILNPIVAFVVLGIGVTTTSAATLGVPEDYPTVQAAADVAADGDTIRVGPGRFCGAVIGTRVNLVGEGNPVIEDCGQPTVLELAGWASGTTIRHFIFEMAPASFATAIGGVDVDYVVIEQNLFLNGLAGVSNGNGDQWNVSHNTFEGRIFAVLLLSDYLPFGCNGTPGVDNTVMHNAMAVDEFGTGVIARAQMGLLTLPPETEPARTLEFGRWDRRQDATEAVQHGTDCHEAAAG